MPAILGLLVRDRLAERRLVRVGESLGLEVLALRSAAADPPQVAPAGLVVELELDGAVALVERWRGAHDGLVIVAFLATPDPDLWGAAEKAGADKVTTRGRVDREAARLLADTLSGARRSRRVRLAAEREFAGRLGFVGRVPETPAGPVAVFNAGGGLHAIVDSCPHAGASLSEGALEGDVITCPRHGSQFCVIDGARVRGPADCEVATVRVLVEAGDVFLDFEAAP